MTSIENKSIWNNSVRWLDELSAIRCTVTPGYYVDVQVEINDAVVYSDTLYAYNTKVETDLRPVLTEEYRLRGLVMGSVKITFTQETSSDSVTIHIINRSGRFSALPEDFFARSFLTASSAKFMPLNGIDHIAMISMPGTSSTISTSIMYEDAAGDIHQRVVTSYSNGNAGTTPKYSTMTVSWPKSQLPTGAAMRAMTIRAGSRQMVYYPAPDANQVFRFRNIFNVEEYLYLRGSVSSKYTTKASVGSVSSQLIRYDVETIEELTAQFAPMLPSEIAELSQLADAVEPKLGQYSGSMPGTWESIIVESAEFNADPDSEELAAPKITFRLKDKYPKLNLAGYGRVHTDQFSEQFN